MLYPNQLSGAHLGERTVRVVRHHWSALLSAVGWLLLLLLLLVGLWWLLLQAMPDVFEHPVVFPLLLIGANIYVLAIWLFFANKVIEDYLDVLIVTSSRVIDIEQHGLFNRTVSELHFDKIQDITTTSRGVAAHLFGYGTMVVTTAGAQERFEFSTMPEPEEVRALILKLARKVDSK